MKAGITKKSLGVFLSAFLLLVTASAWAVDTDNDGIDNLADNCPQVANPDQFDWDNDGQGNLCDASFLAASGTPGSPDMSFGNGLGAVITVAPGGGTLEAQGMIQQADGKFVVVGGEVVPPPPCEPDELCAIYNATYRSVLMRYNSDGSLDSSFNGTGSVVTDVNSTAYSVIQQADGKLVMSGISGTQPALWRYNIDGSIDTDFGNDGKLTTTITNGAPFYNMPTSAYSVIQQTDGKLVAAVGIHYCFTGLCASATDYPFYLLRYNNNGSLDTSFSDDGIASSVPQNCVTYSASVIQSLDGSLLVTGTAGVASFNADGSPSNIAQCNGTSGGPVVIGGGGSFPVEQQFKYQTGRAVIQQSDGKWVISGDGGVVYETAKENFSLIRLKSDGLRDTSFGVNGQVQTDFNQLSDNNTSLIQQMDGKYFAVGYVEISGSRRAFALARYNQGGSLDTTLNATGKLTLAIGTNSQAAAVVQQRDGRLVIAGTSDGKFALVRLESGEPDTDGDGVGNSLDIDDDNDGVEDASDAFPLNATESVDSDGDGVGDNSDAFPNDKDNDGIDDSGDNCPSVSNSNQLDWNNNGIGDACDPDQIITVTQAAPGSAVFGNNFSVAATATSGLPVAITTTGGCSVAGSTVTITSGTNACVVHYNQTGNGDFNAAPEVTSSTTVGKAGQLITVIMAAPSSASFNSIFLVKAATTSNLPVAITTSGSCTGSGGGSATITMTSGAGICSVFYRQVGNDNYKMALGRANLTTANKAYQAITVTTPPPATTAYGDAFPVAAMSGSGQPVAVTVTGGCSKAGNIVTIISGTQDCNIHFNQAGNADYNAAPQINATVAVVRDSDLDGIPDAADNCLNAANADQLNTDGDSEGNACDNDDDNDGVADASDAFPLDASESADTDGDGVGDNADNCPPISNTSQTDTDSDGVGDACDSTPNGDTDGDGIDNLADNCAAVSNSNQLDWDDNGIGDACDEPVPVPSDTDGTAKAEKTGAAVAFAGDFNGDGYGDYVIGSPSYSVPAAPPAKAIIGAGKAEVISGKDGSVIASIVGNAAKDALGFAVAGNADIDKDGFADVVVGAPNATSLHVGSVTVLYGGVGERRHTFWGATKNTRFGSALALDDVNGDDYADVLIGAPKDKSPASSQKAAGSVTVFDGNSLQSRKRFYGLSTNAHAGTAVAAGDVDNDGVADIIVGAPDENGVGSVRVYSSSGTELLQKLGTNKKARFGSALASADINHDGYADIVVGAPLDDDADSNIKDAGSISVISGSDGELLSTKQFGAVKKAWLGSSVALGDVNGDGTLDIIASAPQDNNVPTATNGTGSVTVWNGATYAPIKTMYGDAFGDLFGAAVSAGDINADGKADLIIGIPNKDVELESSVQKDAGGVKVLNATAL